MASYRGLLSCVICFGGIEDDWSSLECGHCFHRTCVSEWIAKKKPAGCPMCRARTRGPRALVGIEPHLDAGGDTDAAAAHLRARDAELSEARAAAARVAEAALARADAVAEELTQALRDARRAERELAKTQDKLSAAEQRETELTVRLNDAASRETLLRQEMHATAERHSTDIFRLRRRMQECEEDAKRARRQVAALRLSSRGLTLNEATTLLDGEESVMAQVLVARNAELAAAERQLEAARGETRTAKEEGARAVEAAERRHRADVAREVAEREKLRRRELQLEYERDSSVRRTQQLEREVAELRGVLVALEGGAGAQQRRTLTAAPSSLAAASKTAQPSKERNSYAQPSASASFSRRPDDGSHQSRRQVGDRTAPSTGGYPPQQRQRAQHPPARPSTGADDDATALDALADALGDDDGAVQSDGGDDGGAATQPPILPQAPIVRFLPVATAPGTGGAGPARAPSFVGAAAKAGAGWTGEPQGALLRQGPDGRGGIARHLALPAKRSGPTAPGPHSKAPCRPGDQQRPTNGGRQLTLSALLGGSGPR